MVYCGKWKWGVLHLQSQGKAPWERDYLKIYFWGKIQFVLGLLARDIANQSYAPNTPLNQAFEPPLRKHYSGNMHRQTNKHFTTQLSYFYEPFN